MFIALVQTDQTIAKLTQRHEIQTVSMSTDEKFQRAKVYIFKYKSISMNFNWKTLKRPQKGEQRWNEQQTQWNNFPLQSFINEIKASGKYFSD